MSNTKTSLSLADLIDIECQFALDTDQDEQVLRARYRQIGQELETSEQGRVLLVPRAGLLSQSQEDVRSLLLGWITKVRASSPTLPGLQVVRSLRRLQLLLFVIGFIVGGAVCKGVLAYDGTTPINVIHFINVFVFLQVVLFVYLLVALFARSKLLNVSRHHVQALGPVYETIKAWIYRGKNHGAEKTDGKTSVLFKAINRIDRYRAPVEKWRFVILTQLFGVGFNLGAVLAFINLVAFTDLAFSWSTTLNMSSQTYEYLIRALAAPWSWVFPDAVPSLFAIEHTQYLRLDQRYVLPFAPLGDEHATYRFTSADAIKSWWPFLLAALIFYGLLPRLLMSVFAAVKARRHLQHAQFDTPEVARLIGWMGSPAYSWASYESANSGEATRAKDVSAPLPGREVGAMDALRSRGGHLVVVTLGNLPIAAEQVQAHVQKITGIGVTAVLSYEGASTQYERIVKVLSEVKNLGPFSMLLLAEGFESPTQEMRSLITQCHRLLPDLWIFISAVAITENSLSPATGDEAAMWEGSIKKMRDPRLMYLVLSPIGGRV